VTWICTYLILRYGQAAGEAIIDEIDRRYVSFLLFYNQFHMLTSFCSIAAASPFPGLRRFPEGRDFKQWTGDDSKALMKVILVLLRR
jgi:hypothetical protein